MNKEALLQENELLRRQIKELLSLDETGFFIELDSLLKAILKKVLVLCNAQSSFFSIAGKDPRKLEIRISNMILEEKMSKIKTAFLEEYDRWQESENPIISVEDFILLPLVRRHKMIGVIGVKLTSDAPENVCEILPTIADQAAASLESAMLYERMFKRLLVLSNVFILGKEIVSNIELEKLLNKFLSLVRDGTDSEIACIYLVNENEDLPYLTMVRGSDKNLSFAKHTDEGYSDLVKEVRLKERHRLITDLADSEYSGVECSKISGKVLKDTIVAPLKPRDRVIGIIQVANKNGVNTFSPDDLDLLQILGSQVAFVIHNSDLFKNLQRAYIDTLTVLTGAIDAKDSYTRGHSDRVTDLSVMLALELGLQETEVEKIKLGGILHDIGKIGIPENILNKPGKLTNQEFEVIKSHPELGVGILGKVEFLSEIVPLVKHHHERFDGRGYPDALKGQDIPLIARIVSVADTYDAMTTDRPYRKGLNPREAIKEIEKCSGSQFDPEVASAFIRALKK